MSSVWNKGYQQCVSDARARAQLQENNAVIMGSSFSVCSVNKSAKTIFFPFPLHICQVNVKFVNRIVLPLYTFVH